MIITEKRMHQERVTSEHSCNTSKFAGSPLRCRRWCRSYVTAKAGEMEKKKRQPRQKNPYKGIFLRKWGRWVIEIRFANTRLWLGSYHTPMAAARAYDVALFYLRGPGAKLNFPEFAVGDGQHRELTPKEIQNRAMAVGCRIDAIQRGLHISPTQMSVSVTDHHREPDVYVTPDLNKYPHLD
ncbi:ethylene-responsive transcription factor RAP2-1-like [Ipomoea triloba]|uniref:ethylene-responsive transcription factor RAP2-1-like n=1 Tax=Ipomoea triloba TaxID=35885 RepID=UPI00125DEB64|nr:ethylene-responsive transcription factor RAP2-1-like [Ipomoea triloba]